MGPAPAAAAPRDLDAPHARKLHVVPDNYGIHSGRGLQRALAEEFQGRIVLHFLSPYSPQHLPHRAPLAGTARERPP